MSDSMIEQWARICESQVMENGREGHDGVAQMEKALKSVDPFRGARALRNIAETIVRFAGKERQDELVEYMNMKSKVFDHPGEDDFDGIIQAFHTLIANAIKDTDELDRKTDIDLHNRYPGEYKHPDRVNPKDIPDRELPQ